MLARIAAGSVGMALALWGVGVVAQRDRPQQPDGPTQPGLPEPGTEVVATVPDPPPGRIEPAWGTRPEVTPNPGFYRVDINLMPVRVDGASWRLEVRGLFDKPRNLSLADLRAMPPVTAPVTLTCISNPVGGDLISNAYWTGVRLRDLLTELGMRAETKEIFLEAADGFYETVTARDMMDERTLLVYGMNGVTLPVEHGYPLRILIPDRYGMKQPKWITSIDAAGEERRRGYWPEREWSEEALVQIMSQVDAAAPDENRPDTVVVGGIAFTGAQGVSKVEVQVENGPWEEAQLRIPPLGPLTWVQWRYEWPRQPGNWNFRVRATDGRGNLQIARRQGPRPDGATGYHVISRQV
jgi:DMSO/TMAO reductase YedYZ molybdopterin-dependent catalytic subunit